MEDAMDDLSVWGIPEWAQPAFYAIANGLAQIAYWWFSVT
nr:hypothetical protein JVH1_4370 [Rhodococcus sp. JVH1]GLK39681.1 hypothetical protein GCM10017611_65520 [Rhodococcus wratislaviensis]